MSVRTCTTFTQLPRCAAARMQHRGMEHRAAGDGAPRALCASRPRCECKWNAHAQSCNRVCACLCYTYVRVHGAALQMCLVRPPGCRLCGAYRLRLVLSCMSLLWRAVQVDVMTRRKGVCAYAWVRCRYGVWNSGCRVQGAGCKAGS